MMRSLVACGALLALACQEPTATTTSEPELPEEQATPNTDTAPRLEPLTDESGRRFPFDGFGGAWSCDVTWLRYGLPREAYEDPSQSEAAGRYREGERQGAQVSIEQNTHAPTRLTAVVEGCPFFVSSIPQPNPDSWGLGPNRCGETRYHEGFMLLHEWTDDFPDHGYSITNRELIVQISGMRGDYHVVNSYSCHNQMRPE